MSDALITLPNGTDLDALTRPGHFSVLNPILGGTVTPGPFFVDVKSDNINDIRQIEQILIEANTGVEKFRVFAPTGWTTFTVRGSGGGGPVAAATITYTDTPNVYGTGTATNVQAVLDASPSLFDKAANKAWVASTAVLLDEIRRQVILGVTVTLRSLSARTTNGTFDTAEAANWVAIGQTAKCAFTANSVCVIGVTLYHQNNIFVRTAAGNTALTFNADIGNWSLETTKNTTVLSVNTYYHDGALSRLTVAGAMVYLYRTTAGTSAATIDAAELANWSYVGQSGVFSYTPNTLVPAKTWLVNQLVQYQRTTTGTTPAGVFATDQVNWTQISVSQLPTAVLAWTATATVVLGELREITQLGVVTTIKALSARTTNATFDTAEAANWDTIAQRELGAFTAAAVAVRGVKIKQDELILTKTIAGALGASLGADIVNWSVDSPQDLPAFVGSTYYPSGSQVQTACKNHVRCCCRHARHH
jgi:hypothetical protein